MKRCYRRKTLSVSKTPRVSGTASDSALLRVNVPPVDTEAHFDRMARI